MNTVISFFVVFLALRTINAQNGCPDRRATCINIRNCPSIIEILRRPRPLPPETLQLLRDSQCGFEGSDPLVCCIIEGTTPPSPTPRPTRTTPTPRPTRTTPTPTPRPSTSQPNVVPDPPDVTNHPNLRLLNHQACGPITQQKVIGGNKTGVLDYPWMALIAYDTGRPLPEFRCGGTLISNRYILTAAHCVTQLPSTLRLIGVRVGDHDISKDRDCDKDENGLEIVCTERYQDFGIERVHFHSEYSARRMQNDIALIRLNDTADFRPLSVKPICLPFGTGTTLSQKRAIVTGWGATEFGPHSQDLLQAKLSLVTNEQCQEAFKRIPIWYKQMCAGGQLMVDSCPGDSGGPLQAPGIYNGSAVRTIQYGVVSFGLKNCGTAGFPGVYTKVAYYMDWILNTMRD